MELRSLERLVIEILLVGALLCLIAGCVVLVRYHAPGRRIARARRKETAAYRKRMADRRRDGPES